MAHDEEKELRRERSNVATDTKTYLQDNVKS